MKLTLLWALPFVTEFALARPADGDSLLEFGTLEALTGNQCKGTATNGYILLGVCSSKPEARRVLYTSTLCKGTGTKCSVPAPECDTDAGQNMGYCMNSNDRCIPKEAKNGIAGRPGTIVGSSCFEAGILCCDGQVRTNLYADLPSQFIDAIQPNDNQSPDPNTDILFSDVPSDDGSVQYSFLDSPVIPSSDGSVQFSLLDQPDNFFTSDNIALQGNDGFLAANNEADTSWFQT